MKVRDLSLKQFADRLRGDGLLLSMPPFVLQFRSSIESLFEPLHLLYTHFDIEPEGGIVDFDLRIDPKSMWQRKVQKKACFFVDGKHIFEAFDQDIVLPMTEWAINWCVFTRPNQYFILHSAVLERNGRAVVLPGPPGAGKSTLCAAMNLRGWRLLSDEVAVFRPGKPDLIPVVRPTGLKNESIDVIQAFEPGVVMGPPTPGTRKGTVAHIQPDEASVARSSVAAPPGWMIFPSYEPDSPTILEPTSRAQTLMRLAEDGFNFSLLGTTGFQTIADFVGNSDCYRLTYSDLEDAIETINRLGEPKSNVKHTETKPAEKTLVARD